MANNDKYELIPVKDVNNDVKYQLRAKKTFKLKYDTNIARQVSSYHNISTLNKYPMPKIPTEVKAGELGGLVSSEYNLSQKGACWIGPGVRVTVDAQVTGNAFIMNSTGNIEDNRTSSYISNKALVTDNCLLIDGIFVSWSKVLGNTLLYHHVTVDEKSVVGKKNVETKAIGQTTIVRSKISDSVVSCFPKDVVKERILIMGSTISKESSISATEFTGNAENAIIYDGNSIWSVNIKNSTLGDNISIPSREDNKNRDQEVITIVDSEITNKGTKEMIISKDVINQEINKK